MRWFPAILASTFFEPADLVANLSGFLVRFAGDGLLQLLAKLHHFGLSLARLRQPTRRLADVPRLAVDILQERQQLLAEFVVVVRTAEPPGVAKFDELHAAVRALALVQRADFVGLFALRRLDAVFLRRF